ncbi:MAG: ADP-ribosylglycohydrolase family protein [Oscillospiraceae bacterium]|nr:ADP-ribosylglycohydrolase family protein [Oscillospiraceae bacterium]
MYGAIIGDTIGSVYEFDNVKTKDFPLFSEYSSFTDDSVMTVAVAAALLRWKKDGADLHSAMVEEMQGFGRLYPHPKGAYGGRFSQWLRSDDPRPYNSLGNGSAMRVSPCGLMAESLAEALELAAISAEVTHNHPEGIKGAQATAAAIYLARTGSSIPEIRAYISDNFYPLDRTLDEIRPDYSFDETCQGTVPEAITAFLESGSFEDAIRNAISLGGDSDTIGAITGAIAWAYYGRDGMQPDMRSMLDEISLPEDLQAVVDDFAGYCAGHVGTEAV